MFRSFIAATAILAAVSGCAAAAGSQTGTPPGDEYKKVSTLVALPDFIPGMGTLYVQPSTLPAGPFLAYDRDNRLVSTIYMVPLKDMEAHKKFDHLAVGDADVKQVDFVYNAGHPGVAEPHYHVILWHVAPEQAKLK